MHIVCDTYCPCCFKLADFVYDEAGDVKCGDCKHTFPAEGMIGVVPGSGTLEDALSLRHIEESLDRIITEATRAKLRIRAHKRFHARKAE